MARTELSFEVLQNTLEELRRNNADIPEYLTKLSKEDLRYPGRSVGSLWLQKIAPILKLHSKGVSGSAIARELNVSRQYVSKTLKDFDLFLTNIR